MQSNPPCNSAHTRDLSFGKPSSFVHARAHPALGPSLPLYLLFVQTAVLQKALHLRLCLALELMSLALCLTRELASFALRLAKRLVGLTFGFASGLGHFALYDGSCLLCNNCKSVSRMLTCLKHERT